jgi:hypothetical protein
MTPDRRVMAADDGESAVPMRAGPSTPQVMRLQLDNTNTPRRLRAPMNTNTRNYKDFATE